MTLEEINKRLAGVNYQAVATDDPNVFRVHPIGFPDFFAFMSRRVLLFSLPKQ